MTSTSKLVVRYVETDSMGIVHHSNYAKWYEVGRTDWIRNLGVTYAQLEESGVWLPLLKLNCEFKSFAKYDDNIEIVTHLIKQTPIRLELGYSVYKNGEKEPINVGSTLHAFTDPDLNILNMKKKHPELYAQLVERTQSS